MTRQTAATRFSAQGETQLDPNGQASIAPEVSTNSAPPEPRQCNLLVEITDLGQATISERTQFVRQSSSFYLGLERLDDVLVAGHPLPIKLVAVAADGNPRTETASARVLIEKREFHTVREQGAGGALNYRTETRFTSAFDNTVAALPLQKKMITGKSAAVRPQNSPQVKLAVIDCGRQRKTKPATPLKPVSTLLWRRRNRGRPTGIIATRRRSTWCRTKDSYAPGEQAKHFGQNSHQWRRPRNRRAGSGSPRFLTRLEGNAPVVRVPIEATDAPNVFVSVLTVRGARKAREKSRFPIIASATRSLKSLGQRAAWRLPLQSSDRAYRPGSEVATTVLVKNSSGRPMADAEIALFAVDEGVLALTGYKAPDPYAFFYLDQAAPSPNRADSAQSLSRRRRANEFREQRISHWRRWRRNGAELAPEKLSRHRFLESRSPDGNGWPGAGAFSRTRQSHPLSFGRSGERRNGPFRKRGIEFRGEQTAHA